jgi:hypothetical protein
VQPLRGAVSHRGCKRSKRRGHWCSPRAKWVTEGLKLAGDEGDRRPMVSGTSMLGAVTLGEGR